MVWWYGQGGMEEWQQPCSLGNGSLTMPVRRLPWISVWQDTGQGACQRDNHLPTTRPATYWHFISAWAKIFQQISLGIRWGRAEAPELIRSLAVRGGCHSSPLSQLGTGHMATLVKTQRQLHTPFQESTGMLGGDFHPEKSMPGTSTTKRWAKPLAIQTPRGSC